MFAMTKCVKSKWVMNGYFMSDNLYKSLLKPIIAL